MMKKDFLVVSSTYICGLCLLNSNLKVQILLVGFQVVLIVVTVFMF